MTSTANPTTGAPVPGPTPFALNPAQAVTDLYDYSTTKDAKLYKSATDPLPTKHDGTVSTLRTMLDELQLRCKEFNWIPLITITDSNNIDRQLLINNRMLTLDDISKHALEYVGTNTRKAQDNHMMVACILNSLTAKGAQALRDSQFDYQINSTPCAPLLIKVLLLDCEVENASTNFFVRQKMTQLDEKIRDLDFNILSFNKHVQELQRKLKQGGEESSDLFMHVLQAYLHCKDRDFVQDIKDQKRKNERGEITLELKTLMICAQRTYQTLIQDGTYNKPSPEEEQIIALSAKLANDNKSKAKRAPDTTSNYVVAAWKLVAPTDNTTVKVVNGKEWTFCETHKKWGQHKSSDCLLKKKQNTNAQESVPQLDTSPAARNLAQLPRTNDSDSNLHPRLTMSAAMPAVLDMSQDDGGYVAYPALFGNQLKNTSLAARTPKDPKLFVSLHNPDVTETTFTWPVIFDSDSFKILVDNGASRCMTNNKKHFIGVPREVQRQVCGLGKGTVTHEGTVSWSWADDDGKTHSIQIPNTLYCPGLPFCLLSPQHLAAESADHHPKKDGTWLATYANSMKLYWNQRTACRTIPLSSANAGVGFIWSAPGFSRSSNFMSMASLAISQPPVCCFAAPTANDLHLSTIWAPPASTTLFRDEPLPFQFAPGDVLAPTSINSTIPYVPICTDELENPQHELLRMHYKLAHLSFPKLQLMAKVNLIPHRLANCRVPKCAACLFGKATQRAWRQKGSPGVIHLATAPGECVSVDQLESSTPGLVAQTKGLPTSKRYTCVTVFIDHFSHYTFAYPQSSTDGDKTLLAKKAFELHAKSAGVTILHYHGDNGRFIERKFTDHARLHGQTTSHCGVNAHFQNGIAERRIRDLQDAARTMLVHAKHHWPDAIESCLWPFAILLANDVHNSTPIREHLSPAALFSRTRVLPNLSHLHPFGCPAYVLDAGMQTGNNKGPKWGERARCGIYLGVSPIHARSVGLIMSLTTGLISAQFHFQTDEFFKTVNPSNDPNDRNTSNPMSLMPYRSKWQARLGVQTTTFLHNRKTSQDIDEVLEGDNLRENEGGVLTDEPETVQAEFLTPQQTDDHPQVEDTDDDQSIDSTSFHSRDQQGLVDDLVPNDSPQTPPRGTQAPGNLDIAPPAIQRATGIDHPSEGTQTRRSARTTAAPRRLIAESALLNQRGNTEETESYLQESEEMHFMDDPISFAATSDPDTMYLHQAQREPDWNNFKLAMLDEVKAHEDNAHWQIVMRKDIPAGIDVLPSVWSMKRKRRIDTRAVYKWKARLTVHGGKQTQGVNFWETYAPVVNWTSIRLHLILSILNNFCTRQIDFVLAYPQADIECEMFMEIPRGFECDGKRDTHALKLLKNIYGTRQAGRVWNQHIHKGLMERGYEQSTIDHCVYYKGATVFLLYVDDGIFAGPSDTEIDDLIKSLRDDPNCTTQYNVTDEGTIDDYLGVKVQRLADGRITLTQPHLIQQILDDLGFKANSKTKSTPALSTKILHRDTQSEPFAETWMYRSVIGKLNFLEKSTRGDISYPVHQCARFATNPRASHAEAVKRIGRYLMGTKNEGVILNPRENSFECYVDADFCGNWNPETAIDDPSTAKSRTGYVIKYAGCPIVWQSKLQTEVTLSTTEAEYVALSTALRDVTSLMYLLQEARQHGIPNIHHLAKVHCRVFEDNSGALELARVPKMRPRTKHLNVKYHHFREHVRKGLISVHPISTLDQQADIYTKPLPQDLFQKFRFEIFGW
jgi:hypothetical protein